MSQYNQFPLQNTCDLSQSSNNRSLNVVTIEPDIVDISVAVSRTEIISHPLNQKKEIELSDSGVLPSPKTRHISDSTDSKNTPNLDNKSNIEKSQIVDETPCYSHFQPNEKTVLLPLVVRSLTTAKEWENTYMPIEQQNRYLESYGQMCKHQDLFSLERKQVSQFNRTSGLVARKLSYGNDFFDKKVKASNLKHSPIPSPPPSLHGSGGGHVGVNMSKVKSQANPLTNEPYLTATNKNTVTDAKKQNTTNSKIALLTRLFSPDLPKNKSKQVLQALAGRKLTDINPELEEMLETLKPDPVPYGTNPNSLNLKAEITGGSVRLSIMDDDALQFNMYKKTTISSTVGKRGKIKELSSRSLQRLIKTTLHYQVMGYVPAFMQTLTLPGEWESLGIDGDLFKKHLDTYLKALDRWFKKEGYPDVMGLWFLEFQKRKAPHYHILFWGLGMTPVQMAKFTIMCRQVWARVVGHPDPVEYEKHLKNGVHMDAMKYADFRYARSYASKKYQKVVPEGFENVGRFWGRYRAPKMQGITLNIKVSDQILAAFKDMVLLKYRDVSHKVARRVYRGISDRFAPDSLIQSFSHELFGVDLVQCFLDIVPLFEISGCEKVPDDALSRADSIINDYFWGGDWGSWLQSHRGVLVGQLLQV